MEDKTAVDVLKEARELIAKPGGWTQRVFARDAAGKECDDWDAAAVCFCARGAIHRAAENAEVSLGTRHAAHHALWQQISREYPHVPAWNDAHDRTQADVVAAFDAAISRASR